MSSDKDLQSEVSSSESQISSREESSSISSSEESSSVSSSEESENSSRREESENSSSEESEDSSSERSESERELDNHNIQEVCQELLYNKWLGFNIDGGAQCYDYQSLKDVEERLYKLALQKEDHIEWYVRKFLFWLNNLTESIDTVAVDFINDDFIGDEDWDELFSSIYFGDLSKDIMDILINLSKKHVNAYHHNRIYTILYNRYLAYFPDSPKMINEMIDGILSYSWLISSESNLPTTSDEFKRIVRFKHNLIVSSIENNTANDNLHKKLLDGTINPPEIIAFMSRQQLLPEFHGKRAQMILTRAEAEDSEIIDPEKMEDGFYECKKCGRRKTKHYEMQTRSADEPMTIFVICYLCHLTWKAL